MSNISNIRLASDILYDSVVDGPGLRMVVFTQGCKHNCDGCHNVESHDLNGGKLISLNHVFSELAGGLYHDGVTISGGEPFLQVEQCNEIALYAKRNNLTVWAYTGFLYENLIKDPENLKFIENIDVLVDGKYIKKDKSLDCKFKGSTNQRIVDVQNSLKTANTQILDLK